MRPGVGWILAGIALVGAGLAVTFLSNAVVWYGAIVVGIIWIVRGSFRLSKAPPRR
ncbi:MAG: hypothetical protein KF850_29250 [Labilithrix sp.]|nr:hypothetical protein [Labilithrix sp.]